MFIYLYNNRSLEKKEREWMDKLRNAQGIQEMAFEHLEEALIRDPKLNGTGDSLGICLFM